MKQPADTTVIRSTCGMCFSCCGILVHVKNNRVIAITGDPQSPVNKGSLCPKAKAAIDMVYHPRRLIYPLKRAGARGRGKWHRISWDEAIEYTAFHLNRSRKKQGSRAVAVILGTAKGLIDVYTERLANAFQTPNLATSGYVCFLPRMFAGQLTHGFFPVPDYEGQPDCILVWGADLSKTRHTEHKWLQNAIKKGSRCIVIDPFKTLAAQKGWLHLPIRPGTDLMLAMGMVHIIIADDLYDKAFVNQWCIGFDKLKHHAANYPLATVAAVTGLSETAILTTARTYATAPKAVIQWGNAIEHGPNSVATARAISILRALTGHLDKPGSDLAPLYPIPHSSSSRLTLSDMVPAEIKKRSVSAFRNHLPAFNRVLPSDIVTAINTGSPYPIDALYISGSNPVMTFSNSKNTARALEKVNFLAVSDRFMTPTASFADIILPPATFLEYDSIIAPPYYPYAGLQQKAIHMDGALSDFEITTRLAIKMGLEHLFYKNIHDFLDIVLEPAGLTFEALKKVQTLIGPKAFMKYRTHGFSTPSGKVELYSQQLLDAGLPPLPEYIPPFRQSSRFPLLLTCSKSMFFRHSDHRQLKGLRSAHPVPSARLHPQTARQFNVCDGDFIEITTARGKITQTAILTTDIRPDVLLADFGWWFPEAEMSPQNWQNANINMLTSDDGPFSPEIGSACFRGIPCTISATRQDQ